MNEEIENIQNLFERIDITKIDKMIDRLMQALTAVPNAARNTYNPKNQAPPFYSAPYRYYMQPHKPYYGCPSQYYQ